MPPVQFDAGVSAGNVTSWSHTVVARPNRYLIAQLQIGSATITGTGVTYAGVAMTFLGRDVHTLPVTCEMWGLVAPTVGTNTIAVTLSGANPGCDSGSSSFLNVDQTTPTDGSPLGVHSTTGNPVGGAKTGVSIYDMIVTTVGASKAMTEASGTLKSWNSGASGDACGYRRSYDGASQSVQWTVALNTCSWGSLTVLLKGVQDNVYPNPNTPTVLPESTYWQG